MEGRPQGTARHIRGLCVSSLLGLGSAFCEENGLGCWRPFLLFRFLSRRDAYGMGALNTQYFKLVINDLNLTK